MVRLLDPGLVFWPQLDSQQDYNVRFLMWQFLYDIRVSEYHCFMDSSFTTGIYSSLYVYMDHD
jgi:hypothetical protein